jgi:DNA-directed RNA polymerase specialized sigma24 family protein
MGEMQDVHVSAPTTTDWEAVYRAEAPTLWRSLVLQTGSPEIAADAVAEAFAQGIARGDAVRKPGAWVWRAAFVIARAEAGRIHGEPPIAHAVDVVVLEPVIDLLDGLRTLSAMQRSATVLHYFAGYSLAETAAILGSTRSAVGVHLFRARRKLRDELGDDDDR